MIIPRQPFPKIPPIGFFEPISVDPKDMMTDVEYLLGILKKLNEIIAQLNSNTKFIEEYTGRIEEIEKEIVTLRNEMAEFETEINDEITARFTAIKVELHSAIATTLIQANAYTDAVASNLKAEIQQISIGQITLYDPTTGITNNLQTVIDNIYGTSREEALTASEYDALQLNATTYDDYELTAFNYDRYGKTLLTS
jgi:phage host-nuclease inhibitor protein Gam